MICESHLWGGLAHDSHKHCVLCRCRFYSDTHSARGQLGVLERRRCPQAKHRRGKPGAKDWWLPYELSVEFVPGRGRKDLPGMPSQHVVLRVRLTLRPKSLSLVALVALTRARSWSA